MHQKIIFHTTFLDALCALYDQLQAGKPLRVAGRYASKPAAIKAAYVACYYLADYVARPAADTYRREIRSELSVTRRTGYDDETQKSLNRAINRLNTSRQMQLA